MSKEIEFKDLQEGKRYHCKRVTPSGRTNYMKIRIIEIYRITMLIKIGNEKSTYLPTKEFKQKYTALNLVI